MRSLVALLLACAAAVSSPAGAHNSSRGKARFDVGEDGRVAITLELAASDLLDLADVDLSSPEEAQAAREGVLLGRLSTRLPLWLKLEGDGMKCPLAVKDWQQPGPRAVVVNAEVRCAALPENLTIHWGVSKATKLDLVAVSVVTAPDDVQHAVVFSKRRPKAELVVKRPSAAAVFTSFFVSGGEHILLGWDHLAFLLALVLGCATLRRLLLVATGFTLAHSVTLALGALDLVVILPDVVEPVIAASIAAAASVGLWRLFAHKLAHPGSDRAAGPASVELLLVGGFGLVHGLGFASMLQDALADAGGVALPLVAFNLGVEVGQVLCVAVAWPLLVAVGRSRFAKPAFGAALIGLVLLGLVVTAARVLG